ncbi:MAG: glycosyltransferase family 4 protein [Desulfobacteraceae bacterium]|nr:glycosyltransferase family 4 protein [Desulfobacteraceae bacterium]MBC2757862.1 glycosyltransferase family 4 protein [Desulfobacteraceae bacterium]
MLNIKYISLYETGGYGIAAGMYLKWLKKAGVNVTWTPMIPGSGLGLGYEPYDGNDMDDPELKSICNIDIPYDLVIVHTVPEYFSYWKLREAGKKVIGMTVWETDRIPGHWQNLINSVDAVIVPTNWNQKIFAQCGVDVPIYVLPHISEFQGVSDDTLNQDHEKFVFYSISDWTNRKTPSFTVDAFLNAFTDNEAVKLILKTSDFDFTTPRKFTLPGMKKFRRIKGDLDKRLRKFRTPPEIELIDRKISPREIQALHQNADCYISLCRAEGWCIPAYEAGWYGNPVVMTGFGGQTEFLKSDNSYRVDFSLVPVTDSQGGKSYTSNQQWAEPDVGHAAEILQRIYSDPEAAKHKGSVLKNYLNQNFAAEKITKQFIQIIEERRE